MWWFRQGTCFLPAFLVVWSASTFIIPYIIGVFERHIDVLFPYISDSGVKPPESCIFGLMTVITAFAALATMYCRYKFVERLSEQTAVVRPSLNKAALWVGVASCVGMCFVATFQETFKTCKNCRFTVHDAGAILFFVSGVLYAILQAVISYRAYPYGSSRAVCHVRTAVASIAFLALFPAIIASFFAQTPTDDTIHVKPDDEYYVPHLVSTVCEWIAAFSFVCFFFTYIDEFKETFKTCKNCRFTVHDAGAILFFVSGVLYAILQAVISYRAYPYGSSRAVCHVRTAVASIAFLALFPAIIASFFAQTPTDDTIHVKPDDEYYVPHLVSTVCEWIAAFSFVCFFFTYIDEFKLFTLKVKTDLSECS